MATKKSRSDNRQSAKPSAIGIIIVVFIVLVLLVLASRSVQLPSPGESVREEAAFLGTSGEQPAAPSSAEEEPAVTPGPPPEHKPDLVVVSVSHIPSSPKADSTVTMSANVKNERDPSEATTISFFVNENLIGTEDVPALQNNQAVKISVEFVPPEPGVYTVSVSVATVPNEISAANNGGTISFTATA